LRQIPGIAGIAILCASGWRPDDLLGDGQREPITPVHDSVGAVDWNRFPDGVEVHWRLGEYDRNSPIFAAFRFPTAGISRCTISPGAAPDAD
jgi:hypothetical protein